MKLDLTWNALADVNGAVDPTLELGKEAFSLHQGIAHTTAEHPEKTAENVDVPNFSTADPNMDVSVVSKPERHCVVGEKSMKAQVKWDCENLAPMELRKKYPGEASSHRNMLYRQKSKGAVVHPAFVEFRSFILMVGAKPSQCATLDRINNADPEYAPGKVRWADKRTQNSNKGDSLIFSCSETGKTFTVSRLSKLHKVTKGAIRRRFERGWSDKEIISGKKAHKHSASPKVPPALRPGPIFPPDPNAKKWTQAMKEAEYARDVRLVLELMQMKDNHDRWSEHHRRFREKNPGCYEDLLEPHHMRNDDLREIYGYDPLAYGEWLESFRLDWPTQRPHIIFERCSPYHRKAIERIDPRYVARHRATLAKNPELKSLW